MGLKLKQWKWFSFRFLGEGKQATSSKLKHIYIQTFIIEQNTKKRERKTEKVAPLLERKVVVKNQHTHVFIIIFVSMKQAEKCTPPSPKIHTHTKTKIHTNKKRNGHEKTNKS